jgi:hypothetical protein
MSGLAARPGVAVAREQPHAVAAALRDQAITVSLDLGTVGDLSPAGRNAGPERILTHALK